MRKYLLKKDMYVSTEFGMIKVLWLHTHNTVMCEEYEYNPETDKEELIDSKILLTFHEIEERIRGTVGNVKVCWEE